MSTPEWMTRPMRDPIDLRTDVPHAARVYDALLGGKTNYKADRAAAAMVREQLPTLDLTARMGREFMHRVTAYLAGEAGVRQFLDIGTGIPTSPNLHEVAQSIAPESRVVYADNDPIVLTHSRALGESSPEGVTTYVEADAGEPESILAHPEVRGTLDWSRPVGLSMLLLLHWLPAERDPDAVVSTLVDALPSGSYVALSYATDDFDREAWQAIGAGLKAAGSGGVIPRSKPEFERLFKGLEMVEPGVVPPQRWRPDGHALALAGDTDVPIWAGVARKP